MVGPPTAWHTDIAATPTHPPTHIRTLGLPGCGLVHGSGAGILLGHGIAVFTVHRQQQGPYDVELLVVERQADMPVHGTHPRG